MLAHGNYVGWEAKIGIMDVLKYADHPRMKPLVVVEGSAKEGCGAPPLGLYDIGVSDKAYLFRVSLPGARKDTSNVKCIIRRNGNVQIQGVMTEGDVAKNSSKVYKMLQQQLCPPGEFTVSFSLPGPVDPRLFHPQFRQDGILEGMVMKHRKAGKYLS